MPAVIREFTEEDLDENVILLVVEIGDKAVKFMAVATKILVQMEPPVEIPPMEIPCQEPDSVMDATKTVDTLDVGGIVTYVCDFGYSMSSGDAILTCKIGPFWMGTLPTCSVIKCKITGLNDYTIPSTTSDVSPTTQVSFTCLPGYKLPKGDAGQRECRLGGEWVSPLPACEGKLLCKIMPLR
ncbi:CSMD [Mytilus edulis]|uniref:CSMD n=1 Tax=Mytilus edulis TaxID=6550 RepID=A0A8S3SQ11_MYTED|nr:CSMD [Mytilus edulis]